MGHGLIDQGAGRPFVGQVGGQSDGLDAGGAEGFNGFRRLGRRGVVVDHQGVTARGQGFRDVPADAAPAGAGHQRYFAMRHWSPLKINPIG